MSSRSRARGSASLAPAKCGATSCAACRKVCPGRATRASIGRIPGAAPTGAARCSGCSPMWRSGSAPAIASGSSTRFAPWWRRGEASPSAGRSGARSKSGTARWERRCSRSCTRRWGRRQPRSISALSFAGSGSRCGARRSSSTILRRLRPSAAPSSSRRLATGRKPRVKSPGMEVARRLRDEVGKLTRQHAARVAVAYAVVAWLVLQVASVVVPALGLPGWAMTFIIALIALGFPVAVILAWAQQRPAEKERQPSELAAAAAGPSIAVLPFADLSAAKDQDFFCDGIAEELLNALGGISGVRVAARNSSFQFRGRSVDTREIARTLGVTTLLEGSVRKAGERVRVAARLVSGDGYELWSDTFDRSLQDIFAIQEEIAQAVVRALRVRLSSHEVSRLQRTGTRNSTAYEMYLRGREFYRSYWDPKQWVLARQMFKGAIELDSQFAQAYAGLADVCFFMLQWHLDDSRADTFRAEALAASEEALRLDPDLAEASLARANMLPSGAQRRRRAGLPPRHRAQSRPL